MSRAHTCNPYEVKDAGSNMSSSGNNSIRTAVQAKDWKDKTLVIVAYKENSRAWPDTVEPGKMF